MTKLDYEKANKEKSGTSHSDIKPHINVSPGRDRKEELVCGVYDEELEPKFKGHFEHLADLLKHISSAKFSKKSSNEQKKIVFELFNLHEVLFIEHDAVGYYGSVLYRKVRKYSEIYKIWDNERRQLRSGSVPANLLPER